MPPFTPAAARHAAVRTHRPRRPTRGVALVEVLFALLLFSIGILGLLTAQGTAVSGASDVRHRALAASLAADLVNRMWLSNRTAATLAASFASTGSGAGYSTWNNLVAASGLPGASTLPPVVTITQVAGGGTQPASSLVSIQMRWQAPNDTTAHSYIAVAQIK